MQQNLNQSHTLLIVDDEESILNALRRVFRTEPYRILTTTSVAQGLKWVQSEPVAMVVSDHRMPEMPGTEFLSLVRKLKPDVLRVLLTGYADLEAAMRAINQSQVFRFIAKPWEDEALRASVKDGLERYELVQANRELTKLTQRQNQELHVLNQTLEQRVQERTQQLEEKNRQLLGMNRKLEDHFHETMVALFERNHAQDALVEQSVRDALTGLYNRHYLGDRLGQEISQAYMRKHALALLFCDLDRFGAVNEKWGQRMGDDVLRAVGERIQSATRGTDMIFRSGADEFAVVLSEPNDVGAPTIVAERIRKGIGDISERFQVDIDVSIGVALYPEHGMNADELIRVANRAQFIAKQSGDKTHIGEEEYQLDESSVKMVFQPIVDVRTNQPLAHEALCRDPHGKLSVYDFFKKYQSIGQLNELKQICVNSSLKAARAAGLKRVFINVDFQLLRRLERISKPEGIEVVLEISELEALHDVENCLKIAREWQSRGFQFAFDDFGAGFISLPFLSRLVPSYIKIDRSTMLRCVPSEQFRSFLGRLLQDLRMYATEGIIAEGVETEEELRIMKEMGIFMIQGFLLGKPQELK